MKIWIVGGTSGIGLACATELREVRRQEVEISGTEVDVRRPLKLVTDGWQPDGLVYSAGINHLEWSQKLSPAEMLNLYDVNVVGLVRVLQATPSLERVVVVGSDAAWRPLRTSAAYCASKAALHMLVKVIARERASENFAINVVAPGMTDSTGMTSYVDGRVPEVRGWTAMQARNYEDSQSPLGRRAEPYEIAEVVADVLLTHTPFLNGAIIPVNGGR